MAAINSSGRGVVLGKIKNALGVSGNDRAREIIVQNRLRGRGRNLIPSRANLPNASLRSLFQTMLEEQSASVTHIGDRDALAVAVAEYLAQHDLGTSIRCGNDPYLGGHDWEKSGVECVHGAATGQDMVSLSHAIAGAAETGTLFLLSGKNNPTSLNFLPETHIVVVEGRQIFGSYEDVWERIRQIADVDRLGSAALPRTVNMISGPSRTGDIEQTIIMGAHGPRRLHVIIVDGD